MKAAKVLVGAHVVDHAVGAATPGEHPRVVDGVRVGIYGEVGTASCGLSSNGR